LASRCARDFYIQKPELAFADISITIIKPTVFGAAEGPGVSILRRAQDYPKVFAKEFRPTEEDQKI
jgi:hypothetical protein